LKLIQLTHDSAASLAAILSVLPDCERTELEIRMGLANCRRLPIAGPVFVKVSMDLALRGRDLRRLPSGSLATAERWCLAQGLLHDQILSQSGKTDKIAASDEALSRIDWSTFHTMIACGWRRVLMRQHSDSRSAMRPKLLVITALVAGTAIVAALFAQLLSSISAQAQTMPRDLPECIASGDLILRKFQEWVFVGSGGSSALPIQKQQAPIRRGAAE
jgi:hypothetical protein